MNKTYQKAEQPFYEGKASQLFEVVGHPELLIIRRKDDITKLDGEVRANIEGKGAYTNRISNYLFRLLAHNGIETHFVSELNDNETLIRTTTPLQLEVIVRNVAAGSLCKRFPFEVGTELKEPLIELNYKDDEHHDPFVNDQLAIMLDAAKSYDELDDIRELARSVNTVLWNFFKKAGIILVDFKLEFGRLPNGKLVLIDEISPDTCRFWDEKTHESLDKDVFRRGGGNDATLQAYSELFGRLTSAE